MIINRTHHKRLTDLLSQSEGTVVLGGETKGDRKLAITILRDVKPDDALMQE